MPERNKKIDDILNKPSTEVTDTDVSMVRAYVDRLDPEADHARAQRAREFVGVSRNGVQRIINPSSSEIERPRKGGGLGTSEDLPLFSERD